MSTQTINVAQAGVSRAAGKSASRKPKGPSQAELSMARQMLRADQAATKRKGRMQVGIELALDMAEAQLESLVKKLPDEVESHAYGFDVFHTIKAALAEVVRMKAKQYGSFDAFDEDIWHVAGLVRCAKETLGSGSAFCILTLDDVLQGISSTHEMINIAAVSERGEVTA